jgi:hypothetical protein
MNRTARRLVAPLALAATLALGAGAAFAAPSVTAGSATEGATLAVPISAKCQGAPRCAYTIQTFDSSATAGSDYTPATLTGSVKKQRTFTRTLSVAILDDPTEEAAETFTVRLTVRRGARVQTFDATETITASDPRAPEPEPKPDAESPGGGGKVNPNPGPQIPADSGTATETTSLRNDGFQTTCMTPFWTGVQGQFGAWGSFQKGCKVTVQCPYRVKGCAIFAQAGIGSEKKVGQKVTMNTRLTTQDTAGKTVFSQDRSCAGTDQCSTDHLTRFDSGAKATFDCNGVRATGPLADRAQIGCQVLIQFEA